MRIEERQAKGKTNNELLKRATYISDTKLHNVIWIVNHAFHTMNSTDLTVVLTTTQNIATIDHIYSIKTISNLFKYDIINFIRKLWQALIEQVTNNQSTKQIKATLKLVLD